MGPSSTKRRLAAILAADVAGYSRLMGADEEGTLAGLMAHRRDLVDPKIGEHRGRIVKTTGDGLLVEFASVVDALRCAVEVQRGMSERNGGIEPERRIAFRIGINVGDIVVENDDIFGDGVNVAARLEGLAEPGGICVSARVREDARGKLDIAFDDLGEQELKNIDWPVRTYRVRLGAQPAPSPGAAAASDKPSIAVLPFTNMSGNPEQQYFSDGITEDIITELARYHALRVIARNSCFQFRGSGIDIAGVRKALGVSYIVEGSIRKVGNRIRLTAQLIDAASQDHIWADRYDRSIEDIFAVQDELTRTIAATLIGRVIASGAERATQKPPPRWVAYDYFLRGRECDRRYDVPEAVSCFARAVELDPDYVHAHAWLATELCQLYWLEGRDCLDEAEAHAQRALALDENDAFAQGAMGWVALRRRQFAVAGEHFARAADHNPNDIYIAVDRACWFAYVGRLEEGLQILDLALQRDPYPPSWARDVRGLILYHLRRYDEAITTLRGMHSRHFWGSARLAASYAQTGQLADAREELRQCVRARPDASLARIALEIGYADQTLRHHLLDGLRKAGLPE
jgi:TolB-like protein/Tfp pilus assembly protein PilF